MINQKYFKDKSKLKEFHCKTNANSIHIQLALRNNNQSGSTKKLNIH